MQRLKRSLYIPLIIVSILLKGCSAPPKTSPKPTLTIYVAASLTDAIEAVGKDFESSHDCELVFNFAGSGALAQQIIHASGADVFLSANPYWIQRLAEAQKLKASSQFDFLSNQLVIVTSSKALNALNTSNQLCEIDADYILIGDPAYVPAGQYAEQWLRTIPCTSTKNAWQTLQDKMVPLPDVLSVLNMSLHKNDSIGIVYQTDYISREKDLKKLYPLDSANKRSQQLPQIQYTAAAIHNSPNSTLAQKFLDFLKTTSVKNHFETFGFTLPD